MSIKEKFCNVLIIIFLLAFRIVL